MLGYGLSKVTMLVITGGLRSTVRGKTVHDNGCEAPGRGEARSSRDEDSDRGRLHGVLVSRGRKAEPCSSDDLCNPETLVRSYIVQGLGANLLDRLQVRGCRRGSELAS
jgi:hypothetical protein